MTDNDLTREIIGAAIEVHKQLGPGLLESAHEECFAHELQLRHLRVERQKAVPVVYKQVKLECGYRIDILVEGRIVVERKSIEGLAPVHEAIVLTYLRLSGHKLGLLVNFNVPILKQGVRRFVRSEIKGINAECAKDAENTEKTKSKLATATNV
jgi:GxxExxY protein